MESKDYNENLLCQCNNIEHQLSFVYFEDELGRSDVYMYVHLDRPSFWQRVKHGIKYIFGYRSMFGDFDEFIFKKEDVHKLERVVEFLKK